jgi:hypothetical protein
MSNVYQNIDTWETGQVRLTCSHIIQGKGHETNGHMGDGAEWLRRMPHRPSRLEADVEVEEQRESAEGAHDLHWENWLHSCPSIKNNIKLVFSYFT